MIRLNFFELFKSPLPENYWFRIAEELYKKIGKIPDPIEIRSIALIKAFGLPSGPYSAIEANERGERSDVEKDRIITKYLTNRPGVEIEKDIVSLDPRDIYPEGLPKELKEVLDPATRQIFEVEYEHARYIKEKFGNTKDDHEADYPIHYFRLPGGIDLILRAYVHHPEWQKIHGDFLKKANKNAAVICIEGYKDLPYGESIPEYYTISSGDYDVLIHDAISAGFDGLFTEVDARDQSKIEMDSTIIHLFPNLPEEFFKEYYLYLVKEQPDFKKYIGNYLELKKILELLSLTESGIIKRKKEVYKNGRCYLGFPYVRKRGKTSFTPTFLELGQHLFSDALAAIKFYLLAKLMTDGYIEKGPIIDYEGAGHLSNKTFFLKHPQYAMMVVLRTINELMAGKVENLPQIYEVFRNPNWSEIVKEIARFIFYKPEGGELLIIKPNILDIYNIDPKKVIPSDEEIQEFQRKFTK